VSNFFFLSLASYFCVYPCPIIFPSRSLRLHGEHPSFNMTTSYFIE